MIPSSSTEVRRLTPPDWPVLKSLRLEALRDSPFAFLGNLIRESAKTSEQWVDLLNGQAWFAAFSAQQAVGLVSSLRDPLTDDRYVESMWVHVDHRGRGVAGLLLREVERLVLAESKPELRLWVLSGNDSAAVAYRRYGFRESGRHQPVPDLPGVTETEFRLTIPSDRLLATDAVVTSLSGGR